MRPLQSFQHSLREISVNRSDPCELVRELISNAYDARATTIRVYPLIQKKGLIFFDNGVGLSRTVEVNEVLPYVAFFSIGKSTRTQGEGIGYKCQGSKLCFASTRFAVITRCRGETSWAYKKIDNPKQSLDIHFDLTPEDTQEPWRVLAGLMADADAHTKAILATLDENFFRQSFAQGTLILIEGFETDAYEQYFSVVPPNQNYLFNYIRFYTAHGDVRDIRPEHGFSPADVKAVTATIPRRPEVSLYYWLQPQQRSPRGLELVPSGWPYLRRGVGDAESPADVHQLRRGRFWARHATSFTHGGRYYTVVLAVDGHRRALDEYDSLERRGSDRRSGIKLTDLRGPLLASNGILVDGYPKIFTHPGLGDWQSLLEGRDHYALIINGDFELVTNRDAPAPSTLEILRDAGFIENIRRFFSRAKDAKDNILAELLQRINRERDQHQENQYLDAIAGLRDGLAHRETFKTKHLPQRFYSPEPGEEHFVGALYTLFAHLVTQEMSGHEYWLRPLTFRGLGVDALAVRDETKKLTNGNVVPVEYKYTFDIDDTFNHPLSAVDVIVCWKLREPSLNALVRDEYNYVGNVAELISGSHEILGFKIGQIRNTNALMEIDREVVVLSLKALLSETFAAKFQAGSPQNPKTNKSRSK